MSRSQGRSATAAAAYRSGQRIEDERTGQTFDYTKRSGVLMAEVILPDGGTAERSQLWNAAETAEKRINSTVAREIVVALPHELSREQQASLVKDYAQGLSERTGWAVDVAIHAPGRAGDLRNVHAHLLCTTRSVSLDPAGCPVMTSKTREWDIRSSGSILIRSERSEWEQCVNQSLEQANRIERVDCRSHAEKQTGLEPQVHLGPTVTGMERKGIQTERGDQHREIAAHNAQVIDLKQVQAERQEAERWQAQMAALETMSIWQIEKAIIYPPIFPQPLERLALAYPVVKSASEDVERLGRGLEDAQRWEGSQRSQVDTEAYRLRQWQGAHPRLNWLHEKGVWESPERQALDEALNQQKQAAEEAKDLTQGWREAHEKAQARYGQAFAQVKPDCERTQKKQEARYAEAKAFLERRREERALGLWQEPSQGQGLSR